MSTKIYSGFKFDTSDFRDIQAYVNNWRSRIPRIALDKANKILSEKVTRSVDRADMAAVLEKDSEAEILGKEPLFFTKSELKSEWKDAQDSGSRIPEIDFDFEVDFILHENVFYGVLRTEHSDWEKAWIASEKDISEFNYWDNTDSPQNISDAEWKQRGKTWEAMLSGARWRPAFAGFTCVIHAGSDTIYRMGNPKDVEAFQPSLEERVQVIAKEIFVDRHIDTASIKDFPQSTSAIMAAVFKAGKDFTAPEFASEVEDIKALCRRHLREKIGIEALQEPYSPKSSFSGMALK